MGRRPVAGKAKTAAERKADWLRRKREADVKAHEAAAGPKAAKAAKVSPATMRSLEVLASLPASAAKTVLGKPALDAPILSGDRTIVKICLRICEASATLDAGRLERLRVYLFAVEDRLKGIEAVEAPVVAAKGGEDEWA